MTALSATVELTGGGASGTQGGHGKPSVVCISATRHVSTRLSFTVKWMSIGIRTSALPHSSTFYMVLRHAQSEAHAVGRRPARAGQFAAQMRMLHRGDAVTSLRPSRHAQCSGHLAHSLSPQHLELLAVARPRAARSFPQPARAEASRRCE